MGRAVSTIAMDASALGQVPPPSWTDEWVRHRLVEAYRVEARLPGLSRRKINGVWPSAPHEFADVVGWEDASERVLQRWSKARGAFAAEISRMEQAQGWLLELLRTRPEERLCLAHWATAIAYNHSLRALIVRRRWSRSTFYRRVLQGSVIISNELQASATPVE